MATIIKSVSFQNFYNYYGSFKQNTYYFKKGINIVNADNNMGKSKFYNGILWILRDKVYDSDTEKMEDASYAYSKMASIKAMNENNSFEMGVKIEFFEDDDEYSVSKIVVFSNKVCKGEKIEVLQTIENKTISVLDINSKETIIKKIIPVELMNYALLQGESMEKLVDLSSRDGLSSTIEALAGMSSFIKVCDLSRALTSKAKKLLNSQETVSSVNIDKIKILVEEREKIENLQEQALDKIKEYKSELSEAKNKREGLEALQLNAAKREQFRIIQKNLSSEINQLKSEKKEKERNITSMLFSNNSPWLLMGLQEEINRFESVRVEFIKDIEKQKLLKNPSILLPEGSPDISSLKRMLEEEICEVCGRPAKKHSEEWKHIEMVMNRPKDEEYTNVNNFSSFYDTIQKTVGSFYLTIPHISELIQKYRDNIEKIDANIKSKQEEYENAKLEFINAGGDGENSDVTDRKNIADHSLAERTEEKMKGLIEQAEKSMDRWNIRLKQIEIELKGINEDGKIKEYRDFKDIMCLVESMFINSKERIFDEVLKVLEANANEKYASLTQGNPTLGGTLCFSKQADNTVQVALKNSLAKEITGQGKGFKRLKQLSIVMAIISSKIGNKQFDYPFISDAPFSEFGHNFIRNFIDIAPKVFSQSIVFIKELYDPDTQDYLNDLGRKVLSKMKDEGILGTFYVNVIEERADSTNLVTKNKCYYKN